VNVREPSKRCKFPANLSGDLTLSTPGVSDDSGLLEGDAFEDDRWGEVNPPSFVIDSRSSLDFCGTEDVFPGSYADPIWVRELLWWKLSDADDWLGFLLTLDEEMEEPSSCGTPSLLSSPFKLLVPCVGRWVR
jgi:hypothetical protein